MPFSSRDGPFTSQGESCVPLFLLRFLSLLRGDFGESIEVVLAVRGVVRLQVRRGAVLAERVVEVAHLLERVTQAVVGVGVCGVVASYLTVIPGSRPGLISSFLIKYADEPSAGASGALFGLVGVLFIFGLK